MKPERIAEREKCIRERIAEIAPLKLSNDALVGWIANLEADCKEALLDAAERANRLEEALVDLLPSLHSLFMEYDRTRSEGPPMGEQNIRWGKNAVMNLIVELVGEDAARNALAEGGKG